ncbi:MAG: hypothetical protein EHM20_11815 [Alphaproteobacteria bacterium]|nr:MAG: hypothetical protein EHM20_11815 [Alphaproteobacteria bacterium]
MPRFNSRIPHFERFGTGTIITYLILTYYPENFLPFLPLLLYHFGIKPETFYWSNVGTAIRSNGTVFGLDTFYSFDPTCLAA